MFVVAQGRKGSSPSSAALESELELPDPKARVYHCPACSKHDISMPALLVHFEKQHSSELSPCVAVCPLCEASPVHARAHEAAIVCR